MLRDKVEQDLKRKYSPEQIRGRLLVEFPDDLEMRVSPETIYQSLYVQSRGALRRELGVCLVWGAGRAARYARSTDVSASGRARSHRFVEGRGRSRGTAQDAGRVTSSRSSSRCR